MPINILCCVTLLITRNVFSSMHIVARLLTAASACCILFEDEASFVFLLLDCSVLCNSRNRRSHKRKFRLISSWWKYICIILFSFVFQLCILSAKVFFRKFFMIIFRFAGKNKVLPYVRYRRNGMVWNLIENVEVLAEGLRCWKLKSRGLLSFLIGRALEDEITLIFSVKNFITYLMTQHNTLEE